MNVRHVDKDWIEIEGRRFRKQLIRIGSGHMFIGIVDWKPGYMLDLDNWVERERFDVWVSDSE